MTYAVGVAAGCIQSFFAAGRAETRFTSFDLAASPQNQTKKTVTFLLPPCFAAGKAVRTVFFHAAAGQNAIAA
jgi:hypothetical protein